MTHQLEYTWSFFVTKNKKKPGPERSLKDWENRLKLICNITSVEEFWGVYNNIKPPTEIFGRGDYFLFKERILPEWEHEKNQTGGAWHFSASSPERVNEIWLHTLLSLIGYQFEEHMAGICGVEMCIRNKKFRMSLWLDTTESSLASAVGAKLKEFVGDVPLEFRKHNSEEVLLRFS